MGTSGVKVVGDGSFEEEQKHVIVPLLYSVPLYSVRSYLADLSNSDWIGMVF